MKKRTRLLLMATLISAMMLPSSINAAAQSNADIIELYCPYEGFLEIGLSGSKETLYSGDVERAEEILLELSAEENYVATLRRDDGQVYNGYIQIYENGSGKYAVLLLDELNIYIEMEDERSVALASFEFEVESNNSIKKANELSGNTIYGRIDKKILIKDVDYFKLTFSSTGNYAIVLDQIPNGNDYDLYVYNESGKQIASSSGTGIYEIVKLEDVSANSAYYAKVEGYSLKDYDTVNPYRLQYATYTPASDDHGNSISSATIVDFNSQVVSVDGSIDYPKDVDYFGFEAIQDGIYSIYSEGNTDTVGCLYDAYGLLIAENDDGDNWNFSLSAVLQQGETYYVSVKHQGIETGTYALCIEAPASLSKPGDSVDDPITISVDTETADNFSSAQAARYFSFTPTESGSYGIFTTGDVLDTYGVLYKSDKATVVTENDNSGDGNHFLLANTLLAGETYYLSITTSQFDMANNSFAVHVKRYDEPNDEFVSSQYHVLNTNTALDANILPAWEQADGSGVLVAIADSGIYYQHADLSTNVDLGLSFNYIHDISDIFPENENNSSTSSAVYGHGTHVAGIIGASTDNGEGIAGVAPSSTLVGYKVLGTRITGETYVGSIAAFVNAVADAKEQGVRIMNCSFGGSGASALELEAMENATDILFVVAAGNSANDLAVSPYYPACYYLDHCLVVSSVDENGNLASTSNYGGPAAIAAQGDIIYSTMPYDEYGFMSGTSMATPVVSGVGALVMSAYPKLSATEVKAVILNNVTRLDNLNGIVSSQGLVNAFRAVVNDENTLDGHSISSYEESRNPFADRDVKAVITEIMDTTSDDEKTGYLFVKLDGTVDISDFLDTFEQTTQVAFTFISEAGVENAYLLQAESVNEADELVNLLNKYDEVLYAEPDYIRQ